MRVCNTLLFFEYMSTQGNIEWPYLNCFEKIKKTLDKIDNMFYNLFC